MENCQYFISNPKNEVIIYDLKGSTLNRFSNNIKRNTTRVDTNFKLERNGDPLYLRSEKINDFFDIIYRDTFFL